MNNFTRVDVLPARTLYTLSTKNRLKAKKYSPFILHLTIVLFMLISSVGPFLSLFLTVMYIINWSFHTFPLTSPFRKCKFSWYFSFLTIISRTILYTYSKFVWVLPWWIWFFFLLMILSKIIESNNWLTKSTGSLES